jgi:hypothetical protein
MSVQTIRGEEVDMSAGAIMGSEMIGNYILNSLGEK